jgi:LacI family transcriptional regulator
MDVARRAGVSLATASRALNGGERRVRADLRERVLAAASELDYAVNAQAQAVARGRTSVVGLLVHDIADPYFSSIAAGVMRAADEHGLIVTLASTMRTPSREPGYIATLRGQRARAVILAGSRVDDQPLNDRLNRELNAFEAAGGRVAVIGQDRLPADTVLVENRASARDLATSLADLGYRRFALLAGPSRLLTARDRLRGFTEGLAERGIVVAAENVVHGGFTRDGGHATMRDLLSRGVEADCVLAVNDVMAVGAMAALREHGIELPQQMGVAGFDDIETLRDVTPALTTVRVPLEEIGTAALSLVILPRAEEPRLRRIPGRVVLRESTPGPGGPEAATGG